jgi:predicted chitinase
MGALLVKGSQGAEVVRLKQRLREVLGTEADSYPGLDKGELFEADTESAVRHWQAGIGIIADGVIGPHCLALLGLRKPNGLAIELSASAVQKLFPATKPSNIIRYLPYVAAALDVAGLTDRPMIIAALGTIRAESEGFLPIAEYPSQYNTRPGMAPFSAYDGRKSLGNTEPGDGARFRGRGFVQLTGRHNYTLYGQQLGIDLTVSADLANAPEVASLLLAFFLSTCADKMRAALAKGDLAAARKLVNGGSHGLDRFKDVFRLADKIWPTAIAGRARAGQKVSAQATTRTTRRTSTKKDPADLRDRPYQPPPTSLPDAFPSDSDVTHYFSAYAKAGLILDQGQEGACTGFGLSCVVNYLRWRKRGMAAGLESVSPRMLYNFARRYDEYEGEDYDGSSCRGALKGWFHHGVCLASDWPYHPANLTPPQYGYAKRAVANTLGVYYRIDTKCITDMQAAIFEVGAIYVSSYTHDGWDVPSGAGKKPFSHAGLPVIPYDGKPSRDGGHAYALVGFNQHGFVIQNSWGEGWGANGFAVISYADWLANGMDAWVAALGVPGVVPGRLADGQLEGGAGRAEANRGAWWSEAKAYEHSLVFGNDGRISRYVTQDELSRTLLYQACGLPDQWFRNHPAKKKRLFIYAHGGLNSEDSAIDRARAMGRYITGNDCYPLFLVWKTGLCESIGGIIKDKLHKEPGLAGGISDAIADASDLLVEKTIGRPLARPIWSEMKENAELCCGSGRGGDLLVTALQKLAATWGDALEIHLVGHSAGSIILGHLLTLATARGLKPNIASIHLYAPACTVQFATRHYATQSELMEKLYLDVLSEQNERDDNVVAVYRKSLLYLVSNALESDLRTPILGMENVFKQGYAGWDGSSATGEVLGLWRQAAKNAGLEKRLQVMDTAKITTRLPDKQIKAGHGCFDNDVATVSRTLERINGGKLKLPVDDLRGF